MDEKVVAKILDLKDKPDYIEALEKILEFEENNDRDWTSYDVKVDGGTLYRLMTKGIIKVTFRSRSTKRYRLIDVEATRHALKLLKEPEENYEEVELPDDMFDVIEGFDDIKFLFRMSLTSEEPVHILLVGPPGTAKSLFLMEIERLPGSVFVTMGGASKSGLRDVIMEYQPRYLIIDELHTLSDRRDVSALLTWMEQGRVVKTVATRAGGRSEVKGKGWVFAAANTTKPIPNELLSRFEVLHLPEYSPDQFVRVTVNLLTKRMNKSPELAKYIAGRVLEYSRDVREAVRIARMAKSVEDVDKIVEIVKKYKRF